MKNEYEDVAYRIGISPVRPDFTVGAYRTLLANQLAARSLSDDARGYIRIDDTDPQKHDIRNADNLVRSYSEIVGDSTRLFSVPEDQLGAWELEGCIRGLRQSLRAQRYRSAVSSLAEEGLVSHESDTYYFNLKKYVSEYGNNLEVNYINSKPRTIHIDLWRGRANLNFPIMVGNRALYHLASVVDDAELKITHVVRGADKIDAQIPQSILRKSLNIDGPDHAYVKMMQNSNGESLRFGDLKRAGFGAAAVRSYLLSSLTGKTEKIYTEFEEAVEDFDIAQLRPGYDMFDKQKLSSIQRKIFKSGPR